MADEIPHERTLLVLRLGLFVSMLAVDYVLLIYLLQLVSLLLLSLFET